MKGKLLIVHGLIDENVHFRHTARLINRLIAAGKDFGIRCKYIFESISLKKLTFLLDFHYSIFRPFGKV